MRLRKDEVSRVLNEVFGTDINWGRLSREDLAQLLTVLNNPDKICEKLCSSKSIEGLVRRGVKKFVMEHEGPVIRFLRNLLLEKENKQT